MQYDAVYLYKDVEHDNYNTFMLSRVAPANPANQDEGIVPVQKKRSKIITVVVSSGVFCARTQGQSSILAFVGHLRLPLHPPCPDL